MARKEIEDYENFVGRMGSFDIDLSPPSKWKQKPDKKVKHNNLDDLLQHHGVKGMRWGVVRWRIPGGKSGQIRNTKAKKPGRIKQEWDSAKRERDWVKARNSINKMTTSEINKMATRIQMENKLKELSKDDELKSLNKITNLPEQYRLRGNLSDNQLTELVARTNAQKNFNSSLDKATKDQRELGMRVLKMGGAVALKYALTKEVAFNDILEMGMNPKGAEAKATQELMKFGKEQVLKNFEKNLQEMANKAQGR